MGAWFLIGEATSDKVMKFTVEKGASGGETEEEA